MSDDAFEELQTAVVSLTERMGHYVSWAEQIQVDFRELQAKMKRLEELHGPVLFDELFTGDVDEIEQRLAAIRA